MGISLDKPGSEKEDGRRTDLQDPAPGTLLFLVVMMVSVMLFMMLFMMLVVAFAALYVGVAVGMVMMFVCHGIGFYGSKGKELSLQPGCKSGK